MAVPVSIEFYKRYRTPEPSPYTGLSIDRSPEAAGVDLAMERDLLIQLGDLKVITGAELIMKALKRRIATSLLGYARWVSQGDTLVEADPTVGTVVQLYLSRKLNPALIERVRDSVWEAMLQEQRINAENVSVSGQANRLIVDCLYTIKPESSLQKLALDLLLPGAVQ